MKKGLLLGFSFLFLLFGSSTCYAKTFVKTNAQTDNKVEVLLAFEEGYVGGIDLTVKVDGAVFLSGLDFDSHILNSYTKRYIYDSGNNTVRIIITTGSPKENLVDKDGYMRLGTLSFSGSEITSYKLIAKTLTIVDAKYASVAKDDLINEDKQFDYVLKDESLKPDDKEEPIKPDDKNDQITTNPPSNNDENNNQIEPSVDDENSTSDIDDIIDKPIDNVEDQKDNDTPKGDNAKDEIISKNEPIISKKKFPLKKVLIVSIIGIILVCAYIGKRLVNKYKLF